MMRLSFSTKKHKLTVVGVVVGSILIAAVLYLFMLRHISPAYAQKACQDFFNDAKSQVAAVQGYTIVESGKGCDDVEDEWGSADYSLFVYFRVAKNPVSSSDQSNSVSEIKSNIDYLIATLPRKDHWLWLETRKDYTLHVVNEPGINGQPVTYCITADRYLDNSGMYMEQDPSHNRGGYVEPGAIAGYAPCGV